MSRHAVPEELSGLDISYRQLDHWCRQGYLRPIQAGRGSGYRRVWPPLELAIAHHMVDLIREGYRPGAAARKARLEELAEAINLDIAAGGWETTR